MVIDFNDHCVEAKALDTKPFDVIYRWPTCGLPRNIMMDESSNNALYSNMKNCIAATYKIFKSADLGDIDNIPKKRKVAFATEVDDDGATIVTYNVQDGMSIT